MHLDAGLWYARCNRCGIATDGWTVDSSAAEKWNSRSRKLDYSSVALAMAKRLLLKGVSIRCMARKLKVSASYVSDLLKGRRVWTKEKIEAWEKALK